MKYRLLEIFRSTNYFYPPMTEIEYVTLSGLHCCIFCDTKL